MISLRPTITNSVLFELGYRFPVLYVVRYMFSYVRIKYTSIEINQWFKFWKRYHLL